MPIPTLEPRYVVDFRKDNGAPNARFNVYVKDGSGSVDTRIEVRYRPEIDDWFIPGSAGWHNIEFPLRMNSFIRWENARNGIERHVLAHVEEYIDSDFITRHGWPGEEEGEPPPFEAVPAECLFA